jgi:hypothetical protein
MDWSYFAGFFDGEGSISIAKCRTNIEFTLCIATLKKEQLEPFAEFLGNQGIHYVWRTNKTNRIGMQRNSVTCLDIHQPSSLRNVLENMYPYLVLKQPQCAILLRALSLHRQLKSERKMIMQNLEGFDILRKELHQYSHKGPRHLKQWK